MQRLLCVKRASKLDTRHISGAALKPQKVSLTIKEAALQRWSSDVEKRRDDTYQSGAI